VKIAFVHDWKVNYQQELDWQDGLSAALKELEKRGHQVARFVCGIERGFIPNPYGDICVTADMPAEISHAQPDVILHWADMTRPNAKPLKILEIPMALCFAGGETNIYNTYDFNHVFVESQIYKNQFDELGVPCSIAFGTNTDLFKPVEQVKSFDTIFPGTFAAWKRHSLYANAVQGLRSLAVGYKYNDHEQECWEECLRLGTTILPHVSAEVLHYLYASSKICVVTSLSSGGSQRTVLEAMAMNLPLIVTDSDKYDYLTDECFRVEPEAEAIRGAVKALLDGERTVNTRQHILDNWSHITYADALETKLKELCNAD
jgi:glycosyltransferase involved in cell wall biosynthesis